MGISNFFYLQDEPKKVQLEKVFKCEIDSGLWDKALVTALSDITHKSCPHVFVIQSLVNYALVSIVCCSYCLLEISLI